MNGHNGTGIGYFTTGRLGKRMVIWYCNDTLMHENLNSSWIEEEGVGME